MEYCVTFNLREHSANLREHSVKFREHSVNFREQTVDFVDVFVLPFQVLVEVARMYLRFADVIGQNTPRPMLAQVLQVY